MTSPTATKVHAEAEFRLSTHKPFLEVFLIACGIHYEFYCVYNVTVVYV